MNAQNFEISKTLFPRMILRVIYLNARLFYFLKILI